MGGSLVGFFELTHEAGGGAELDDPRPKGRKWIQIDSFS